MKKTHKVALATLFGITVLASNVCDAVDSNRSSTLTRSAPEWAKRSADNFSDPSYGYDRQNVPTIRDRTNDRVAEPTWNDPSLPANDPLRNNSWQSGSWQSGGGASSNVAESTPTWQKWRLGIYPEDTDTGVKITEVVSGSAAQRAGLERNDRIIAVHGYQVGYVNGTLYDCGQEFERHADQQGWVRILVQNNRNGQLLNMPLQLDPRHQAITGTVAYRDRSALPRDAVLNIELREVLSYSTARPIVLTRQSYTAAQQPISFSLDYDPTQIDSRRNYVLHANITAGGRQIYAQRQDAPILGSNPSQNVQLLVESTGSSFPGNGPYSSTSDQLAQISSWFREYLRREPRAQELYVWEAHLARGGSLTDAQLQILSTPEFYYQSNADDAAYVRRMFQLVTNRQPSQQEISQWLNRLQYHNRLRPEMAREFLAMAQGQASR
ncbi:MAG: YbaY family lipoprotein [Bythopirellula sp.]